MGLKANYVILRKKNSSLYRYVFIHKVFIFGQFLFLQKRYDLLSVSLLNNKQLRPASRKSISKLIQIKNLKTVSLFSLEHNRVQRLWAIRVSIRTYERCYRFEGILASGDEIKLI